MSFRRLAASSLPQWQRAFGSLPLTTVLNVTQWDNFEARADEAMGSMGYSGCSTSLGCARGIHVGSMVGSMWAAAWAPGDVTLPLGGRQRHCCGGSRCCNFLKKFQCHPFPHTFPGNYTCFFFFFFRDCLRYYTFPYFPGFLNTILWKRRTNIEVFSNVFHTFLPRFHVFTMFP